MRRWRDLLPVAPRQATLTADAVTVDGASTAILGYVWVGDPDAGRAYLPSMRSIGRPVEESVTEMTYLELQSIGDANHHHGKRRYATGHYLTELTDVAIDAFLNRGVASDDGVDWTRIAAGGLQAYGGAIGEVAPEDSAFTHRDALVEFFGGQAWTDASEDAERMDSARAFADALAPYSSGVYVNVPSEQGEAVVRRAYGDEILRRLSELKRRWDPDNAFHLNQNIAPA
jgi:Berberine and berberine like